MLDSYIRDYEIQLLENTYADDLERLKSITYGLDYILQGMENNIENNEDRYTYNRLTTCYITLKDIVDKEQEKYELPF